MPRNIFDDNRLRTLSDKYKILRSPVPHVPPEIRPKTQLSNWYILFEANWEEYPIDPFLLRRIGDTMFFIVEEEWELTELEAMIASGLR